MAEHIIPITEFELEALRTPGTSLFIMLLPNVPLHGAEQDARWYPNAIPPGTLNDWSWWWGPPHGQSIYHTQMLPARGDVAVFAGDRYTITERPTVKRFDRLTAADIERAGHPAGLFLATWLGAHPDLPPSKNPWLCLLEIEKAP